MKLNIGTTLFPVKDGSDILARLMTCGRRQPLGTQEAMLTILCMDTIDEMVEIDVVCPKLKAEIVIADCFFQKKGKLEVKNATIKGAKGLNFFVAYKPDGSWTLWVARDIVATVVARLNEIA